MGEYVQILNGEGKHWITVNNIGMPKGEVMVFGSLYNSMAEGTAEHLCALMHTP